MDNNLKYNEKYRLLKITLVIPKCDNFILKCGVPEHTFSSGSKYGNEVSRDGGDNLVDQNDVLADRKDVSTDKNDLSPLYRRYATKGTSNIPSNRDDNLTDESNICANSENNVLDQEDVSIILEDIMSDQNDVSADREDIWANGNDVSALVNDVPMDESDDLKGTTDVLMNEYDVFMGVNDVTSDKSDGFKDLTNVSMDDNDVSKVQNDVSMDLRDVSSQDNGVINNYKPRRGRKRKDSKKLNDVATTEQDVSLSMELSKRKSTRVSTRPSYQEFGEMKIKKEPILDKKARKIKIENDAGPSIKETKNSSKKYKVSHSGLDKNSSKKYKVSHSGLDNETHKQLSENIIKMAKQNYFNCDICEIKFESNVDFKRHMYQLHLRRDPHRCIVCRMEFIMRADLQKHLNEVHPDDAPHKCKYCHKVFISNWDLNKLHMQTHVRNDGAVAVEFVSQKKWSKGQKMIGKIGKKGQKMAANRIEKKNRRTAYKQRMEQNGSAPAPIVKNPEPEPQLSCYLCKFKCVAKIDLTDHMSMEHFENADPMCDFCGGTFLYEEDVEEHVKNDCMKSCRKFPCVCCVMVFEEKRSLMEHLIRTHFQFV